MEAIAIVTSLALLQVFAFGLMVAKARGQYGVSAPAISGNANFEREFRVHQNTIEQIVIMIPSMWIFATYVHVMAAAGLGLLFIISRIIYRNAYLKDPGSRSMGFTIGALCTLTMLLGGLAGAAIVWLNN